MYWRKIVLLTIIFFLPHTLQAAAQLNTMSVSNAIVIEGNSGQTMMTFTVSLEHSMNQIGTFNYFTSDGTATAGSDYVSTSGVGSIAIGETSTTIQVPVNGDTIFEPDETFTLTAYNFTTTANYYFDGNASGLGTIRNDDVNNPPIAVNDNYDVLTYHGFYNNGNVLDNDSDPDGDSLSIISHTNPSQGTLTLSSDGTFDYEHTGIGSSDSFTYTVSDGNGGTATATVTFTIPAPYAADDSATTNENVPVDIDVTANDEVCTLDNIPFDPATVTIVSQPLKGSADVNTSNGHIIYTPNPTNLGLDSFTYTVADEEGRVSNEATVEVTVTSSHTPPTANNDSYITNVDTPAILDILTNDAPGEDPIDAATIMITASPNHGSVVLGPSTGEVTYTPNSGYSGSDSFTYTVDDTSGYTSNVATVIITIPLATAVDDTAVTGVNQPVDIDVTANDTPSSGGATILNNAIAITDAPNNGSVAINTTTGIVTYTPNTDFNGTDTFAYRFTDSDGAVSNEATVTVYVLTDITCYNNSQELLYATAPGDHGYDDNGGIGITSADTKIYRIYTAIDGYLETNITNLGDEGLEFSFSSSCTQAVAATPFGIADGDHVSLPIVVEAGWHYIVLRGEKSNETTRYNLLVTLRSYGYGGGSGYVGEGSADIVNNFTSVGDYNAGNHIIQTKIVRNAAATITAVHLESDGTASVYTPDSPPLFFLVIPYLSDDSCTERIPLLDTNGKPLTIQITDGLAAVNAPFLVHPDHIKAMKKARIKMTFMDFDSLYTETGDQCLLNSSTTGNLQGIGQCINSPAIHYEPNFGTPAYFRCVFGNGQPCLSNYHGYSCGPNSTSCPNYNPIYDNEYGCLMCTLDSNYVCSTDNFAIRPDTFDANLTSGSVRIAGNIDLHFEARDATAAPTPEYDETDFSTNPTFTAELNISDPSKTCPEPGIDITPVVFSDGVADGTYDFDNVGTFDFSIHEINGSEFAKVDANDTNDSQRFITPFNAEVYVVPDHFRIEGNLTDRGPDFTYLSNFRDHNNPADRNMSASLRLRVSAVDANDTVLSNYIGSCYAYPTDLTLQLGSVSSNLTLLPPPLTQLLAYDVIANTGSVITYDLNDSSSFPATGDIVLHNTAAFFKTAPDPATDTNGSISMYYLLNFDRKANKAGLVNPIIISVDDMNMTETGTLPFTPTLGNYPLTSGKRATFYYGRLHAPRYRVNGDTSDIALYYEVFCSPSGDSSGAATPRVCDIRDHAAILPNRRLSADDIHWFVNEDHNATYGTIDQSVGDDGINERVGVVDAIATTPPATATPPVEIFTMQYNQSKGYPFKATMQMSTQNWLLYDPFDADASTNDFELEFSQGGGWQGKSSGNISVDSNASVNTNRRIEW